MNRETFIKACETIVRQDGACMGVRCTDCPGSSWNHQCGTCCSANGWSGYETSARYPCPHTLRSAQDWLRTSDQVIVTCDTVPELESVLARIDSAKWRDKALVYLDMHKRISVRVTGDLGYDTLEYYLDNFPGASFITATEYLGNKETMDKTLHQLALEALSLQPGDKIKVLFPVPDKAQGWSAYWDGFVMNDHVNKVMTVEGTSPGFGVSVKENRYWWPAQACEIVSRAPKYPATFRGHEVSIADRMLKVGCQSFNAEQFYKIKKRIERIEGANAEDMKINSVEIRGHEFPLDELLEFVKAVEPALKQ